MPKRSQTIVKQALERDDHTCQWCGATGDLAVHHIIPVSEGGPDTLDNVMVLCDWCHHEIHWPGAEPETDEDWRWLGRLFGIDMAIDGYSSPVFYFYEGEWHETWGCICGLCGEDVDSLHLHRVKCRAGAYEKLGPAPWIGRYYSEGRNVDVTRSAAEQGGK